MLYGLNGEWQRVIMPGERHGMIPGYLNQLVDEQLASNMQWLSHSYCSIQSGANVCIYLLHIQGVSKKSDCV